MKKYIHNNSINFSLLNCRHCLGKVATALRLVWLWVVVLGAVGVGVVHEWKLPGGCGGMAWIDCDASANLHIQLAAAQLLNLWLV